MYRVGFGDFFLLTVPDRRRSQAHPHRLRGSRLATSAASKTPSSRWRKETGGNLALLIMTHRHADHISGFATCKDVFSQFTVERVWMSWFENPNDTNACQVPVQPRCGGGAAQARLAARTDPDSKELTNMAENITGEPLGFGGASSNSVALGVLHGGFKNRPPIDYYQGGRSGDASTGSYRRRPWGADTRPANRPSPGVADERQERAVSRHQRSIQFRRRLCLSRARFRPMRRTIRRWRSITTPSRNRLMMPSPTCSPPRRGSQTTHSTTRALWCCSRFAARRFCS